MQKNMRSTANQQTVSMANNDTVASEAAKTLDEVVANLGKNFSDSTEYFQVCFLYPFFSIECVQLTSLSS